MEYSGLRKKVQRHIDGLKRIRFHVNGSATKAWFNPKCPSLVSDAERRLSNAESRAEKLTYLLDHGATRQTAKLLRKSQEFAGWAVNLLRRAHQMEDDYRKVMDEEIHAS